MNEKYIDYFDRYVKLDFFPPSIALNPYIEDYIYFSFPTDKLHDLFMHPFPNGNLELYFCIGKSKVLIKKNNDEFSFKNFLITISELADQTLFKTVSEDDSYSCILVELRINSLKRFFNMPLGNFKNEILDIDFLWGVKAEQVKNFFKSNHDIGSMINYLNSFFESFPEKVMENKKECFFQMVNYCIQNEGQLTVEELIDKFKISYRTILRLFVKEIGITPKEYFKILRFNKVCLLINKYPEKDWSELYFSCGYYDQSHFIHDFKEIMKSTPDQFFKLTQGKFYLKRPYYIVD